MSQINQTIQGPQNVADGRIDGRGLNFVSPLQAIGQSFTQLGQLGQQMAIQQKQVHDSNQAAKAEVAMDLKLQEASAAMAGAVDSVEFNSIFEKQNEEITQLAESLLGGVDGVEIKSKLTNRLNLLSGSFAIEARKNAVAIDVAELTVLKNTKIDMFEMIGDYEGAAEEIRSGIGTLWSEVEAAPRLLSNAAKSDRSEASEAVFQYRLNEDASPPNIDGYQHLGLQEKLQLRQMIEATERSRGKAVESSAMASASMRISQLVTNGASEEQFRSAMNEVFESGGLDEAATKIAMFEAEREYFTGRIRSMTNSAIDSGDPATLIEAAKAMSSPEVHRDREDIRDFAVGMKTRLLNLARSAAGSDSAHQLAAVQRARVFHQVEVRMDELAGPGSVVDGALMEPEDYADALWEATGIVNDPEDLDDGTVAKEGDVSILTWYAAKAKVRDATRAYRDFYQKQGTRGSLDAMAAGRLGSKTEAINYLGVELAKGGFDPFQTTPEKMNESFDAREFYAMAVDAMNTQQAVPDSLYLALRKPDRTLEETGALYENLRYMMSEFSLDLGAFSSQIGDSTTAELAAIMLDYSDSRDLSMSVEKSLERVADASEDRRTKLAIQDGIDKVNAASPAVVARIIEARGLTRPEGSEDMDNHTLLTTALRDRMISMANIENPDGVTLQEATDLAGEAVRDVFDGLSNDTTDVGLLNSEAVKAKFQAATSALLTGVGSTRFAIYRDRTSESGFWTTPINAIFGDRDKSRAIVRHPADETFRIEYEAPTAPWIEWADSVLLTDELAYGPNSLLDGNNRDVLHLTTSAADRIYSDPALRDLVSLGNAEVLKAIDFYYDGLVNQPETQRLLTHLKAYNASFDPSKGGYAPFHGWDDEYIKLHARTVSSYTTDLNLALLGKVELAAQPENSYPFFKHPDAALNDRLRRAGKPAFSRQGGERAMPYSLRVADLNGETITSVNNMAPSVDYVRYGSNVTQLLEALQDHVRTQRRLREAARLREARKVAPMYTAPFLRSSGLPD